jgi:hypothetical protein
MERKISPLNAGNNGNLQPTAEKPESKTKTTQTKTNSMQTGRPGL